MVAKVEPQMKEKPAGAVPSSVAGRLLASATVFSSVLAAAAPTL